MSQEIIAVLDDLCAKLGIAVDWTSENVFPYIEQLAKKYINFELSTSIFWVVFCTIFVIAAAIIAAKSWKKADFKAENFHSWVFLTAIIVAIAFCIIDVVVISFQSFDIITCITFPEKILFDYISRVTRYGHL